MKGKREIFRVSLLEDKLRSSQKKKGRSECVAKKTGERKERGTDSSCDGGGKRTSSTLTDEGDCSLSTRENEE